MIRMREMLSRARGEGYAVGYFEAWDEYSLEAVLEVAEECRSPVILGFGCALVDEDWYEGGGGRRLAALGAAAAEGAKVPACLLLNEAKTFDQVERGLARGFNAVMLGTSHLSLDENIAATRQVSRAAHALGADVEGELGRLPDASGTLGGPVASALTDPEEAARYVEETAVDALAVSIGNVHMMTQGAARVDFERLGVLHQVVSVPLVVHGGSGFPDRAVSRAVALGVAKFNVGTVLKQAFLKGLQEAVAALPHKMEVQQVIGSRRAGDLLERAKQQVKAEVRRRIMVYGSAGKA